MNAQVRSGVSSASELNVSTDAVKGYMSSIFMKLGVSNRTEAALIGLKIFRAFLQGQS
jgi:DNA-binding NarL/FixJ family response regulator